MFATDRQTRYIHTLSKRLGRAPATAPERLTIEDASKYISQLQLELARNPRQSVHTLPQSDTGSGA